MTIAIYGSRRQDDYEQQLAEFFSDLAQRGIEVVMHRKLYDLLLHIMPARLSAVRKVVNGPDFSADVALSIGGDGTFLRTAMWVGDKEIPILGINTGHLGFLSSASIDELPQVAAELTENNFELSSRSLIQVQQPALNTWAYALNEVCVAKEDSASMILAKTQVNGVPLADYRADGVIVCTPTGSTAYNLSVGGPIIMPSAPVWAISPIAAHSLGMRPLILSDTAKIDISVEGRAQHFRLVLDGRAITMPMGTRVSLQKAPFTIRLIKRPGHTFQATLRQKLRWSE